MNGVFTNMGAFLYEFTPKTFSLPEYRQEGGLNEFRVEYPGLFQEAGGLKSALNTEVIEVHG